MKTIRWKPLVEMMRFRNDRDRLFEESYYSSFRFWPEAGEGEIRLDFDIYQTDNDIVVKAHLPGVKPDEVGISIIGDILTIMGVQKEEHDDKEENYFCREYHNNSFSSSIHIPASIKSDKAEAMFKNGVLILTLPKVQEQKPKQINVKAKIGTG